VGAYLRFFERRIEKQLREQATKGIAPPPVTPNGIARDGQTITDRRQLIPPLGLREYWYPAMPAKKVPKKKPLYWRMLGDEIAFFYGEDGNIAAVSDICPHRGASLSAGSCFFKGTISCPYHGATFNAQGECKAFIPEGPASKMVDNLRVKAYPTKTYRGWVFIWMGSGEPVPIEEDVPPELFDEKTTVFFTTYTYWACGWMVAIENQNDSHNGFYAHRNSLLQLTMNRARSRTPLGPRSKLLNDRALIPLMKNQNYYADESGKDPYQLYYPGVDGHWPIGQWRRWVWALFKPWNKMLFNRWRKPYKPGNEEWANNGSLWHLPSIVRVNYGMWSFSRYAVPVTENMSRIVYFHHRTRASSRIVQWIQTLWFYGYFNWWHHYNFSGQDGVLAAPTRYWTEENLSSTDSHMVMLRKLVTERSRDVKRKKEAEEMRDAAQPIRGAESKFFDEQNERGVAVESSLDEAAAHTEQVAARAVLLGKDL
jgi:phenylpropionate dioxygenase-like ring-hydroxylating dioxygenase large terminal subunit